MMLEPKWSEIDLKTSAIPRTNERQKFFARLLVVAERAEHRTRYGLAVLLFHAAHLHAKMARFDNHADALRRDFFFDRLRNLAGHALLNLQPPREHVHEPRDFAQAENFFRRQIRDVRFAEKWKHVMLAQAEKLDVLDDHQFVVTDAECCAVQDGVEILMIATGQKLQRFFKTLRSFAQSFAVRIFADQFDDFAHMARDAFRIQRLFFIQDYFFGRLCHGYVPWLVPGIFKAVVRGFLDANSFQFRMRARFQALENFDA